MALSKSLQKGQIPKCCQLCEESNEIKWKCLQCDFLLCTKCHRLHKKVKSTDQHTIIDIKDIAVYQIKDQQDFSHIPCEIHCGQLCCLFCQSCDDVVCPLCIAKTHNKHNMIELTDGYASIVKKIKTFNFELESNSTNYVKGISKLLFEKSSEDLRYVKEKQKILSREKVLKGEVEIHTQNLLEELDQRLDIQTKLVKDTDFKSQKINKDLDFRRESLSNALASVNTCNVFIAYKEEKVARKQSIEPFYIDFQRLPHYEPGKMQIQQAFHGELIEPDDNKLLKLYDCQVITKLKTELRLVEMIFVCADGLLWISDYDENILQKIQFSNGLVKVLQKIHVFCGGMILLKSGDLLISTAKQNLEILSDTTGELTTSKYCVAPLITGNIHFTKDASIIIRARKKGPLFPVKGPRKVVVMDIDGKTEKVYDLDNNGKPLFSAPQKIKTDNDNNIYVIDRVTADCTGRVIALNKTNGVRWIYSGNSEVNKGKVKFTPSDLVCTKLNNIIITEMQTKMLHILNSSGQCFHYINTEDTLGINLPYSLEIDSTGTLYIGCCRQKGQSSGASIYVVHFSGF